MQVNHVDFLQKLVVLYNMLGDFSFESILPIIIVVAIVIAIIIYLYLLNKGLNSGQGDSKNIELEERRASIKVSRVSGFMPDKYRTFYEVLKKAMPSNYIILPNIAVELLFQRAHRKDLQLEGQYVSYCVFTSEFAPVLVISLNDFSDISDVVFRLTASEKRLIQASGIAVLEYNVRDNYSIDDLRRSIAKTMNPLYLDK